MSANTEKRSRLNAIRANTLKKKKKKDAGPVYLKRPSLSSTLMGSPKHGFELLRKYPIYTYDTIQEIITEAMILHNIKCINPWFANQVGRLQKRGSNTLHVLECLVREGHDRVDTQFTSIKMIRAPKHELDKNDHPCLALIDICALEPGGCLLLKDAIEENNRSFLIGVTLMYYMLNVFAWWELPIYSDVDDSMTQFMMMRQDDEENKDADDIDIEDPTSWESAKGDVYLHYMNHGVTIADVKKEKHEWIAAKEMTLKVFGQMMAIIDIEFLERVVNEPSAMGAWYRGIVYLIVNKFNFMDYAQVNEDYDLPTPNSFGLLWDADSYLAVWDEHSNGYHEGGPASLSNVTYVFEDGIRTTKDKDPKSLMFVFSALFYYDPKKQQFYNAQDHDFQTYLSTLRLHKWQGVLRRAIARNRKRRVL